MKATKIEIKKAYRNLARKYQPDINLNNNAAKLLFRKSNEANKVLSDLEKWKNTTNMKKNENTLMHFRNPSFPSPYSKRAHNTSLNSDYFSDFSGSK